MTPEQQRIVIAEACGWRRWKFGDPWRKGQRLADQRFNGFIRHVIQNASEDSETVKLDIDEAWTVEASDVIKNYIPVSHWVKGSDIRASLPNYLNDLNAMHEAVKTLPQNMKSRYFSCLCAVVSGAISLNGYSEATEATATQRAVAFLRTLNLWKDETK